MTPRPRLHTPFVRRALGLAVGIAIVAAATGCAAQASTKLDTKANVTLTMWSGQTKAAEDTLQKLVAKYEKLHPNVTINLSPGASDTDGLLQKLSAAFAGNDYPDISYAYGSWASQLEASDRTLDITKQVAAPSVNWTDFTSAARETARPTGHKTIGFPAVVDNISLLYNKTLFDKAGVSYPTTSWTWSDFEAAAKKLTDPSKAIYGYGYSVSGDEETTWQFWPHLWQNGGSIISKDGKTAAFDSTAGVDALTLLRTMAVTDKSVYLDQTDDKYADLFVSNKVAMITSGPWELADLKTGGTKYGVVELPGTKGDHQTVSGPDVWALFDHHDANRAYWAYNFTEWLTSAAQDEQWNVAAGNLPLRSSEVSSATFKAQAKEFPGLDVMEANAQNAKQARPTAAGYNGLSVAIGDAISKVLQGSGTPAEALKAAAVKATAALHNN